MTDMRFPQVRIYPSLHRSTYINIHESHHVRTGLELYECGHFCFLVLSGGLCCECNKISGVCQIAKAV